MAVDSAAVADPAAVAADSASRSPTRVELFGIPVDAIRRSDVERRIIAHLADTDAGLLHIATVNPEYVVAAQRDRSFWESLSRADVAVPDGAGIVVAGQLLCALPFARITGVELVESLLTMPSDQLLRIFLLGNPTSIAELHGRHPTRVVGRWGGGTASAVDDLESISRIRDRGANVVLVGYGAPGQVCWIERNRKALADAGVRVAIGVGGALDFVSKTVERAPEALRDVGLEWAYRLVREPWRWRRQLALPVFAGMVIQAKFTQVMRGECSACRILAHDDHVDRPFNP